MYVAEMTSFCVKERSYVRCLRYGRRELSEGTSLDIGREAWASHGFSSMEKVLSVMPSITVVGTFRRPPATFAQGVGPSCPKRFVFQARCDERHLAQE